MSDTSFISHRMFVAALAQGKVRRERTRLVGGKAEMKPDDSPEARTAAPYGKEVMAAALARQLLPRNLGSAPNGV